jgi:Flp pilus assembly protein TadB
MSARALALGGATAALLVGALPARPPRPPRADGRHMLALGRLGSPRSLAAVLVLALAAGAVLPPLGLGALVVPLARRWLRARRSRSERARALGRALPDTVDLLLLAVGAGLSVPLALPLVARRAPEPVGEALRAAEQAAAAGQPLGQSLLDELVPLGDRAAALAHVLHDHLRYGVPLAPALERSALELRLARRRAAEESARRLPVRLLAPLLLCILPAFVLLTVVPLLVAALRALPR